MTSAKAWGGELKSDLCVCVCARVLQGKPEASELLVFDVARFLEIPAGRPLGLGPV